MGTQRYKALDVGIENVNLKVTTDNNGAILNVKNAWAFTAIVDITETWVDPRRQVPQGRYHLPTVDRTRPIAVPRPRPSS